MGMNSAAAGGVVASVRSHTPRATKAKRKRELRKAYHHIMTDEEHAQLEREQEAWMKRHG